MATMLLKTRDLTWQDRALNIEVMLEPRKTQLLFKKNKSLTMNYEKASVRYEKQRNTLLRMYKNEKRYIEERNQEYYLVRTQKFLENIPTMARNEMLKRPSFSISLSKLTKELNEEEALNRASAPPVLMGRHSTPKITILSDDEEDLPDDTSLPSLKPDEKELIKKLKLIGANFKDTGGMRSYRSSDDIAVKPHSATRTRSNSHIDFISRSHTPIPSYLPTASSANNTSGLLPNIVPESPTPQIESKQKPEVEKLYLREKSVRFDKNSRQITPRGDSYQYEKQMTEKSRPKLQKKVNDFLIQQSQFNKQTHLHKEDRDKRKNGERGSGVYGVDRNKLVDAFDDLCNHGSKDKLHKLVKYATKIKVNKKRERTPSIVPSVEIAKASRTFQTLHTNIQLTANVPQLKVNA